MSESRTKQIENTHDVLRLFYTVILTVALSEGLLKFINSPAGEARWIADFSVIEFSVLFIFLLFVGRFFLGGVRHLDARYDETSLDKISAGGIPGRFLSVRHFVGLDILLLSLDAFLLLYVGSSIRIPERFFLALTLLLVNAAIWGVLIAQVYDLKKEDGELTPEMKWSINNGIFAVLFSTVIFISPGHQLAIFVGLGTLNSVIDFILTWDFYFPFNNSSL